MFVCLLKKEYNDKTYYVYKCLDKNSKEEVIKAFYGDKNNVKIVEHNYGYYYKIFDVYIINEVHDGVCENYDSCITLLNKQKGNYKLFELYCD